MASLSERPTPAGIETTEGDQVFRNPIITFVGAAAAVSDGGPAGEAGEGFPCLPTPAGLLGHRAFSGPEGRHPELLPPEGSG